MTFYDYIVYTQKRLKNLIYQRDINNNTSSWQ